MQHELGAQQLTDQELYQIQVRDLDLEEWQKQNPGLTMEEMQYQLGHLLRRDEMRADWLMASNPLIGMMPQAAQGHLEGAVDEAKKQQNLAQGAEMPPGA